METTPLDSLDEVSALRARSSLNRRRNLRAKKPKSASATPLSVFYAHSWNCSAIGSTVLPLKRSTGRSSNLN